ncbi:lipid II flippase family protein [Candidatus Margulisiibacteriota bacterium]
MDPLYIVCIFTGIIHFTETAAATMRLAGVRTRQIATSLSFVNATLLVSRMSNMIQAPLLGGMVDTAILKDMASILANQFRLVILAAFIGNALAAVLVPFFVFVFTNGIRKFEELGSLPKTIAFALRPTSIVYGIKKFKLPTPGSFKGLSLAGMPKGFLIMNLFMVSIYTIGVLASLYAGALVPAYRVTATMLSGIVNGIATILLTLLVDPTSAWITDQAARGKRPESQVRAMIFYIVLGRVVGALVISQLIFLPASNYIRGVTLLLQGFFQ